MPITINELKSIYDELFTVFEKRQIPPADMLIHMQGFLTHSCYVASGGDPSQIQITKSVLDDHFTELTTDLMERNKHAQPGAKR